MAPTPLQQGDPPWLGNYQLTARLGAGGMGVVYLGKTSEGKQVAVKVLRPEYASDTEFRTRFRREVAAMVRVQNRYTVQVLDADRDSETPYLVTEYAEGPSLDEFVKTEGPLPPDALIRLASALAEALAAIHAAGVTHRDLKPSNVLLTDSGPMVIDFGIAQTADSVSITRTGMAVGSPGYMAPEQIIGQAGQEADVFAWALIVSFASSGQPPFGPGQATAIMHRILNGSPDISNVPPRLLPLVQAAISRDPAARPTAVDLVRELAPGALGGIAPRTTIDPALAARTSVDQRPGPGNTYAGQGADYQGAGYQGAYQGAAYESAERTHTITSRPAPRDAGRAWEEDPRDRGGWDDRPPRRWRGAALVAAAVVVAGGVGIVLLSQGHSTPGKVTSSYTNGPTPASSAPVTPGRVAQPVAPPVQQPVTSRAAPSPAKSTHKPSSSPSAAPSVKPSTSSPAPSPSGIVSTTPTGGGTSSPTPAGSPAG